MRRVLTRWVVLAALGLVLCAALVGGMTLLLRAIAAPPGAPAALFQVLPTRPAVVVRVYLPYVRRPSQMDMQVLRSAERVRQTLADMTPAQKIGQMLISGLPGDEYTLTPATCQRLRRLGPAGITFQWNNVTSPAQMRAFTAGLRGCTKTPQIPLFFSVAHEGEYVHRFDEQVTRFPSALGMAATGDTRLAGAAANAAGQELAASGLNMVLGPVGDVLLNTGSEVIAVRTYSGDPQTAAGFVQAVVAGYGQAGIISVLKHFPGHGGVSADTHNGLVVDTAGLPTLEGAYLPPFIAGLRAGAPVVMLSHIAYPAISGDELPATLSPAVAAYLRTKLNFQGVILSDSMRMKGVSGQNLSVEQAALRAAQAGVDLLLLNDPAQAEASFNVMLAAYNNGTLSAARLDEAVGRILTLKFSWNLPVDAAPQPEPDWQANQALALQAGRQSVTLLRDREQVLPLPPGSRVLVIGPAASDDWRYFAETLSPTLQSAGVIAEYEYYPNPTLGKIRPGQKIARLTARAAGFDALVVFTWQSHLLKVWTADPFQADLVNALQKTGIPLVVVALKSPTDLLDFPQISTYLATYGTTPGALEALAQALVGQWQPTGVNPLPGLP